MKEKQYENVGKDLALDAKEEEGTEVELDVKKEVDKVVDVIDNLKDNLLLLSSYLLFQKILRSTTLATVTTGLSYSLFYSINIG